jgi:hypothetical protein
LIKHIIKHERISRDERPLRQRNRISLFAVPQPQCPMKSGF